MKVIRRNVFETNSSSTHSISIKSGEINNSNLFVNYEDNKVHVKFGEYGWGYDKLRTQSERLSYVCTMLVETEGKNVLSVDEFYNTNGFKQINDLIASKCNCDGISFGELKMENYNWGDTNRVYLDFDGYIDHQSCEDYLNIDEFLKDWNVTLEEFIFNDGITVIIDNDNH